MSKKAAPYLWFFLSLLLHILLFIYRSKVLGDPGALEQEHFLAYTFSLKNGFFPESLSYFDTRLFPGLAWLILLFDIVVNNLIASGLLISLLAFIAIFFLVYKFTYSGLYAFWLTLFPPIVFEQLGKISTETVVIAIFLLAYFLLSKRKYLFTAMVLGLGVVVRPVSICFLLAFVLWLYISGRRKIIAPVIILSSIPFLGVIVYNLHFFQDPLYQFYVHVTVAPVSIPFYQIVLDIRSYVINGVWGKLFSGIFYLLFSFYLMFLIIRFKSDSFFKGDSLLVKLWTISSMAFIFLLGPPELLGELRRFLAVLFPLQLLFFYKQIIKKKYLIFISLPLMVFAFY